jgi:hypothetical protein
MLPLDKRQHAYAGAAISLLICLALPAVLGFLAACVAGVVKESYDWYMNRQAKRAGMLPKHTVEWQDAAATALAGGVVALVFELGRWLLL